MSHFSDIGFDFPTGDSVLDFAKSLDTRAEKIPTTYGYYIQYKDPNGAEIWFQVNHENQLLGYTPYFRGLKSLELANPQALQSQKSIWEGQIHGTSTKDVEHPLCINIPNWLMIKKSFGKKINIYVTAFAEGMKIYETYKAYQENPDKEGIDSNLAEKALIPTGLFFDEKTGEKSPRATVLFSGIITFVKRMNNHRTGNMFYWLGIDSLGHEYDVVADPKMFPNEPRVNQFVIGDFWLSGIIER